MRKNDQCFERKNTASSQRRRRRRLRRRLWWKKFYHNQSPSSRGATCRHCHHHPHRHSPFSMSSPSSLSSLSSVFLLVSSRQISIPTFTHWMKKTKESSETSTNDTETCTHSSTQRAVQCEEGKNERKRWKKIDTDRKGILCTWMKKSGPYAQFHEW